MRVVPRLLCLLAALVVADGHLLIGQSVAWLTMIHERAPELGLEEAIADTFSGESPCGICLAIQEEHHKKQEETPIPEATPLAKAPPGLFADRLPLLFPPNAKSRAHPSSESCLHLWQVEVPTPPPWLG